MAKKKRSRYCNGCCDYRPNENFTAKGRKKHLCKNCEEKWDNYEDDLFDSDDNFAFIAGYTEGGVPFGITYEEWEQYENTKYVTIKLENELADELKSIFQNRSIETSVHFSIIATLFLANRITLERAAFLANCEFNDFISLLELNGIPWDIGETDWSREYSKSMCDLLMKIDQFEEIAEASCVFS